MFELDPRLKENLIELGTLASGLLFLMPDSQNPWCVIVPQHPGATEIHHLPQAHQHLLLEDINRVSQFLEHEFSADKINIGALGNIVSQLHIHIITRYQDDRTWPAPIWGIESQKDKATLDRFATTLKKHFFPDKT